MKIRYLIAALMVILVIAGCKTAVEEAPQPAPESKPAAPVVEVPQPTDNAQEALPSADINIDTSAMTDSEKATLQRYKDACDRGNAGLCAALKRMEEKLGVDAEDALADDSNSDE